MDSAQLVAVLLPIVVIQVVLMVLALRDLTQPERRVRGDNKVLWAIVIVAGELIGPLVYFALGRDNE